MQPINPYKKIGMFPLAGWMLFQTGATSPFAREKVAAKQKHRLTRGAPGKFGLCFRAMKTDSSHESWLLL